MPGEVIDISNDNVPPSLKTLSIPQHTAVIKSSVTCSMEPENVGSFRVGIAGTRFVTFVDREDLIAYATSQDNQEPLVKQNMPRARALSRARGSYRK